MSKILASITGFFRSFQKKHLIFVLLLVSSACFAADEVESEMLANIVVIMNLILSIMLAILTPAIILLGWLLSPDWTMGDFFGLRKYFLQVWILVSNLVYIIFALLLLYMAIMQIFNGESEYAFKQKLPHFLGGILLVPFTWLIVSWTLSFANQAVAAVLSIPMGAISSIGTTDENNPFNRRVIPRELSFSTGENSNPENFTCQEGVSGGKDCMTPAEFVTHNGSGPFFIILIYAYDIFKINSADVVKLDTFCNPDKGTGSAQKDARGCIKDLMGIVRSAGMSLIVTVFFGIMTIALCWVLLMRAIKLWIYVMFSPLFGLAYFTHGQGFSEALSSEGGGGESMGFTQVGFMQFFKLAMVPVLVAAVLSFGLLFVGVMRQSFNALDSDTTNQTSDGFCSSDMYLVRYCFEPTGKAPEGYTSKLIIGSAAPNGDSGEDYTITFNFGDMLTGFIGDAQKGEGSVLGTGVGAVQGTVESVESIFAHIIITLIALAVMWTGVKAAVNYDDVTKAAFAPFAKMGESVTTFVQHIPSYLPMPHPAFGAAFNPGQFASSLEHIVDKKVSEDNLAKKNTLSDMFGGKFGSFNAAFESFKNGTGDFNSAVKSFLAQEHKDPKVVRDMVLAGIEKLPPDKRSQPDVQKLKVDIERDLKGANILDILTDHSKTVSKLESESSETMKGIAKLSAGLGASATSASHPFHGADFAADGGIKIAGNPIVTKDATNPTTGFKVNLNQDQQAKVREVLDGVTIGPDDNVNTQKLQSIFPGYDATRAGHKPEDKEKLLKELKSKL